MKKRLLSIFLVAAMVLCLTPMRATAADDDVPINAINFPDAKFRAYVKDTFDENNDNILSASELETVTLIDCRNENISSLTGIECFTNLEVLFFYGNSLTSLDVSKNTNLETLDCGNNQLTSLDVSKNTNLQELYCDYNQLTSLDVSKNTNLQWLICDNNQLTSLDISKNTKLEELYCGNNQLASLDTSKNTKLEELYCSDNCYVITAVNNTFDLNTLSGGFDVSKASDWSGATIADGKLTIPDGVSKLTYKYNIGQNQSETFTLTVTHMHNHAWSADWSSDETAHWHECTIIDCPTADNNEKDGYALHADTDKNHICDTCGKTISEHSGGTATCKGKAVCTVCGEEYGDLAPHELTHIAAKEATATNVGNTEYWHCNVCDKYFSNENATTEIALAETVVAKLAPTIIAGDEATVTESEKKALSFTSDAAVDDFFRAEVDGKMAAESNDKKSPQTGDTSNLALWFALLLASGGAITVIMFASKKKTA